MDDGVLMVPAPYESPLAVFLLTKGSVSVAEILKE